MMALLQRIQSDALAARKRQDKLASSLLVTLGSEAAMVGKNDNRDTTDAETEAVIRKFLKGINEVLNIRPQDKVALAEKAMLESYLPKQMSEDELKEALLEVAKALNLDKISPKDTGALMKGLSAKYAGRYQGGQASALIKNLQS